MDSKEYEELLKDCTEVTDVEVTGLPKDNMLIIATLMGEALTRLGLNFEYGGIGADCTDKICGISFEVKEE